MDLLEHQGKQLFAAAGMPVLRGCLALTAEAARDAAGAIGLPVVVKAQVRTGGRGKAGGVRVCATQSDVTAATDEILSMSIRGQHIKAVLVEEAEAVARELYLAIACSRSQRCPLLIFSAEGGVDIEEAARRNPAGFVSTPIDPSLGICDYQVRQVVAAAALDPSGGAGDHQRQALAGVVRALWRLYRDSDAMLIEINPLAVTRTGQIVCLDSKVTIDDNALGRHPEYDVDGYAAADERELKAREAGLAFVPLEGDIGVLGNGAGLVMSTIDQIAAAGGSAADFCDLGGGARADVVAAALDIILSSERVSALLVSVFGGITRCDEVAHGLVQAFAQTRVEVPVVVRLDGNAAGEGRAVLAEAGLNGVAAATDAEEAVRQVIAAASLRGRSEDSSMRTDRWPS